MKTFTEDEVKKMLQALGVYEHDNFGQIVIYTGVFEWSDGSYHDQPDPRVRRGRGTISGVNHGNQKVFNR